MFTDSKTPLSPLKGKAKEEIQWRSGWWDFYPLVEQPHRFVVSPARPPQCLIFLQTSGMVRFFRHFYGTPDATTSDRPPFFVFQRICHTIPCSDRFFTGIL